MVKTGRRSSSRTSKGKNKAKNSKVHSRAGKGKRTVQKRGASTRQSQSKSAGRRSEERRVGKECELRREQRRLILLSREQAEGGKSLRLTK
jgi:hypothetical protein